MVDLCAFKANGIPMTRAQLEVRLTGVRVVITAGNINVTWATLGRSVLAAGMRGVNTTLNDHSILYAHGTGALPLAHPVRLRTTRGGCMQHVYSHLVVGLVLHRVCGVCIAIPSSMWTAAAAHAAPALELGVVYAVQKVR